MKNKSNLKNMKNLSKTIVVTTVLAIKNMIYNNILPIK